MRRISLSVCHTVTAQTSNTGDHVSLRPSLQYRPPTNCWLLIHLIAQDTVVNCQCNLAGCLGTVTYNTGSNSKSIYRCGRWSIRSAPLVAIPQPAAGACIDCAAVCAKTADGGLLMDS